MLHDQIEKIDSTEGLADFVAALVQDLESNRTAWENVTLGGFLEAMESWIRSMDSYYRSTGQSNLATPSWRTFADILYASRIYE